MSHTHHFRIAYNLAMGLPAADGWTPVLLIRACRTCLYAECFHGTEHRHEQRNRLHAWEAWVNDHLHSQGDTFHWKAQGAPQ